jgi:hypothetical protein
MAEEAHTRHDLVEDKSALRLLRVSLLVFWVCRVLLDGIGDSFELLSRTHSYVSRKPLMKKVDQFESFYEMTKEACSVLRLRDCFVCFKRL